MGTHKYDDGPASSPSQLLQHLDDDGPTSLSPFCNCSDGDDDDAGPSSDLCVPTEPQPNELKMLIGDDNDDGDGIAIINHHHHCSS